MSIGQYTRCMGHVDTMSTMSRCWAMIQSGTSIRSVSRTCSRWYVGVGTQNSSGLLKYTWEKKSLSSISGYWLYFVKIKFKNDTNHHALEGKSVIVIASRERVKHIGKRIPRCRLFCQGRLWLMKTGSGIIGEPPCVLLDITPGQCSK